jgi:predicted ATPase
MFQQANVDQVKELGLENRRITISGVACMFGILFGAVSEHFERQPQHALCYCQVCAALVEGGAEEELYTRTFKRGLKATQNSIGR